MYYLTFIILIALDQLSKIFALKLLKNNTSIQILGDWFKLSYVENKGAAFGQFSGHVIILIPVTFIFLIFLIYACKVSKNFIEKTGFFLIICGAIGNLIDRIFNGFVIDFLDFDFIDIKSEVLKIQMDRWPVFNLADSYICIGACMVLIAIIFLTGKNLKRSKK